MDLISTPDQLPKDRSTISDDTMITTPVWATLQGVKPSTVSRKLADAKLRRAAGESRPGDMPAEDARVGNSPVWTMKTYRAWDKQRPGIGAGGGRPKGSGVRGPTPRALHLPEACPHCGVQITGPDVREMRSAEREGRATLLDPEATAAKLLERLDVDAIAAVIAALPDGRAREIVAELDGRLDTPSGR